MSIEKSLLSMQNISKAFPGVQALDKVTFEVRRGEIHALVGENGAGKSTLVRILGGATLPDGGDIYWRGQRVSIHGPADAQSLGISMIHQELAVIPHLDIGKNIFLGREPVGRVPGIIDWSKLYRQAVEQLDRLGLEIDPHTLVKDLTIAQQQMVEVVKALSLNSALIVMDEPTSSLTESEVDTLFQCMADLRGQGVSIVFVSHRLDEIFRIADRLTILRDGQLVGTRPIQSLNEDEVITMMVGRELISRGRQADQIREETVLRVENLFSGDRVQGVTLNLRRGEILGLAGLVGAGRTALAEAIFGARPITGGSIWLEGKSFDIKSPAQAIELGLGFVPEDRKAQGLFLNMSVKQNVAMAALETLSKFGFLRRRAIQDIARKLVESLQIRTKGLGQRVRNLSGGNQQKVVIARWLALEPKLLILDEPTRGIDVGAKAEIHHLLRQMASRGVAILMVSSDLPEVLSTSDRVLVMREGKIVAELDPRQVTQDDVMGAAARSTNGSKHRA